MSWSYKEIMKAISDFETKEGKRPKFLIVREDDWYFWPHKGMTEVYGLTVVRRKQAPYTGVYAEDIQ